MKASAEVRAARLVVRIEEAIGSGEFTPDAGYLQIGTGPCGCAMAAAAVVTGVALVEKSTMVSEPLRKHLQRRGFSSDELSSLEAGYECGIKGCSVCDAAKSPAFFDAGRELRKFHPYAETSS